MQATFVKKEFSKKDWEFFSKVNGYMFMEKSNLGTGENVWAAFMTPSDDGYGPEGTVLLSDEELRRYDDFCRAHNIHPRPFETKEIISEQTEEEKQDGIGKMESIKDWLHKKKGMFKV